MKAFGFTLLLLLVLGVAAFVLWPGAPTYAKQGPYLVGAREFVIKTSLESRPLPATLWYPALKEVKTATMDNAAPGGTSRTFSVNALQDAAPDPAGGPYPLVVYSHGSPGTRADAVPRMEHWASHGFVVLAVDHGKYDKYRSADLRYALDLAEQLTAGPGPFAKFIDTQRTGAAGFSFGGLSVLYMGTGLSGEPRDPRIKALVLLAPVHDQIPASSLDLSAATLPTLVAVGSKDDLFTEVEQVYQGIPAPRKSLVTLTGGTHRVFIDPSFKKTFWSDLDWETPEAKQAQDLIHHFTTGFLLDVLKGDPEAHKALLPEAVKFEDAQYTTTWK
jgi:predicted dienelactone hydrolase